MSRLTRRLNILMVLVVLVSLSPERSYAQSGSPPPKVYIPLVSSNAGSLPPIIPSTTKVFSTNTTQQLASVSPDGTTYTFSSVTPDLQALKPGDVMASGITSTAPDGFLRKVDSISSSGGKVVVTTSQAALTDAIQQGTIDANETLTASAVTSQTTLPGVSRLEPQANGELGLHIDLSNVVLYDADGNSNTTNDQIVIHGGAIDITPNFRVHIDIKDGQLQDAYITGGAVETTRVPVVSSVNLNISLWEKQLGKKLNKLIGQYYFGDYTSWIVAPPGLPFPIVITPKLDVRVGVDGEVSAGVSMDVTQKATLTVGEKYANGEWSPVANFTNSFTFNNPQYFADAAVKGYGEAYIQLLFYHTAGPGIGLEAYLKFEADALPSTQFKLSAGLEAGVDFEIEILTHVIASFSASWPIMEKVLLQVGGNQPPNIPSNPNPPDHANGQGLNLDLSWSGGDPDGDAVTYTVYLEADNPNPTTIVSSYQNSTQYTASSLASNTTYYWQIIASDEHGASTAGPVWNFTTAPASTASSATLEVTGVGNASGESTYSGTYNTLYVGNTGNGDWPECSGSIESMKVEPLVGGSSFTEDFNSSSGFSQTDPDVYIANGKVNWTIYRDKGDQYIYKNIPAFSGDVRLTVVGQIESWTNNCNVRAGIGEGLGSGISINFGFFGGGCATNGPVVTASGVTLDYSENNCNFTGNWLWITSGTPYTAILTISSTGGSSPWISPVPQ
jgi:hypothetical protein